MIDPGGTFAHDRAAGHPQSWPLLQRDRAVDRRRSRPNYCEKVYFG